METLLLGICGHCESRSHTKIGISATLNAKGTRALDKLQTTSVTKELRGFSDKPDVSVDPNSHSFGLTTLNHVVHVWVLIKKLNIACKTWHYSLEDSCERVKEKKKKHTKVKNVCPLIACELWVCWLSLSKSSTPDTKTAASTVSHLAPPFNNSWEQHSW